MRPAAALLAPQHSPLAAAPCPRPLPSSRLSTLMPLLLISLLAALLPSAAAAGLPCERSGYCSVGRTRPYLGEVESSLGLRAALASRSYRREVILMATDSERMLPAMQAVANLARLGLEHVMMLGAGPHECARVAAALPSVGCVWLDFELPIFGADREFVVPAIPMWHNRYRLAARAVRLQYNVFLVDTDVIFFDDPYVYLKSPPFANFTIINQPEVLYDQADYAGESDPNGGVLYVQNAAPDGPAAWLLAEVTDRLLRWVEDGFNTSRHTHGLVTWCDYMDQDGLRDAISSVRLGRVFFASAMRDCRTDEWKAAHGSEHEAILGALEAELGERGSPVLSSQVELPAHMRAVAGNASVLIRHFDMRRPAYAPWNASFGPYLYPPSRGVMSKQWLQQLRADCDCPLWPDPEDPASAAPNASFAGAPESYLLAPPFLMLNWFARGRFGYWQRALSPAGPQQVVGHLHYIPGTSGPVGKTVARMAVGHYDWSLAHQVLGHRMYFLHQGAPTSTNQPGPESQPGGPPPLHLLAPHPHLAAALAASRSWREYLQLLSGLAKTAAALKRVPVWPDVPCSAHWVAEEGPEGAASLPLRLRMEFIPYGRKPGSLSCVWLPLLTEGCLAGGRGMLALEFAHWRAQHRMASPGALEPGEHNTIGVAAAALGAPGPALNATPTARVFSVAMDEVARAWGLRRTHTHRVLYLLNPLAVTFPANTDEAYAAASALSECKATNVKEVEEDLTDKPYANPADPTINIVPASIGPDGVLRPSPPIPGYNTPMPDPADDSRDGDAADAAADAAPAATANITAVGAVSSNASAPSGSDPVGKAVAAAVAAAEAATEAANAVLAKTVTAANATAPTDTLATVNATALASNPATTGAGGESAAAAVGGAAPAAATPAASAAAAVPAAATTAAETTPAAATVTAATATTAAATPAAANTAVDVATAPAGTGAAAITAVVTTPAGGTASAPLATATAATSAAATPAAGATAADAAPIASTGVATVQDPTAAAVATPGGTAAVPSVGVATGKEVPAPDATAAASTAANGATATNASAVDTPVKVEPTPAAGGSGGGAAAVAPAVTDASAATADGGSGSSAVAAAAVPVVAAADGTAAVIPAASATTAPAAEAAAATSSTGAAAAAPSGASSAAAIPASSAAATAATSAAAAVPSQQAAATDVVPTIPGATTGAAGAAVAGAGVAADPAVATGLATGVTSGPGAVGAAGGLSADAGMGLAAGAIGGVGAAVGAVAAAGAGASLAGRLGGAAGLGALGGAADRPGGLATAGGLREAGLNAAGAVSGAGGFRGAGGWGAAANAAAGDLPVGGRGWGAAGGFRGAGSGDATGGDAAANAGQRLANRLRWTRMRQAALARAAIGAVGAAGRGAAADPGGGAGGLGRGFGTEAGAGVGVATGPGVGGHRAATQGARAFRGAAGGWGATQRRRRGLQEDRAGDVGRAGQQA